MEETLLLIDEEFDGVRIDKFLANYYEDKSRSYLQGLIEKGNILVNDKIVLVYHGDGSYICNVEEFIILNQCYI